MLRYLLFILALFDTLLGGVAIAHPVFFAEILWPGIEPDKLILLQRTGLIWLFFAIVEGMACHQPNAQRVMLVAFLRIMDIFPDLLWAWTAFPTLTTLGKWGLWSAPLCNSSLGIYFYLKTRTMANKRQ